MAKQDWSFIGFGRTFAKRKSDGFKFEVGNNSALNLSAEFDERSLANFKTGQGNANSRKRVSTLNANMVMHDVEQDNLTMGLYGTAADVASGSVTDEAIVAKIGGLSATAQINISNVVVTDSPMTSTYVEGSDYEITAAGIVALPGGNIADDEALLIDYDYSAAKVVEALTGNGDEYELIYVGLNDARNGKPVVVYLWRVSPSFMQELSLIGEDYAAPPVDMEVLEDATKSGTGISKYFKYVYVE